MPALDSPLLEPTPFEPVLRPPGHYPRIVQHAEIVEYSYDPETNEVAADMVDASHPMVTTWDADPPLQDERAVGGWSVVPGLRGLDVMRSSDSPLVPSQVLAQLRQEAAATGGRVTRRLRVNHLHVLDQRKTEYTAGRCTGAQARDAKLKAAALQREAVRLLRKQAADKRREQEKGVRRRVKKEKLRELRRQQPGAVIRRG